MSYTSSLSDKEWMIIEPILLEHIPKKKQTRPLKWGYREMLDAMLYQLKNGCTWADLPKDFPPYSTVYWHYKQWRESGLIDKLLDELYGQSRQQVKNF
jgi:transposase